MIRPRIASAVLLLGTVLVAGCDLQPRDATDSPLAPETEAVDKNIKKTPGGSPDHVGPLPDVWVEPSDALEGMVANRAIDMKDSDFLSTVLGGLDLYVDPCRSANDLVVRVAVMNGGDVVAAAESDGGILLEADAPVISPGTGEPGGGASCRNADPVHVPAGSWGASVAYPNPADWHPHPDNWHPHPDQWIPAGELIPDPDHWSAWPAKWHSPGGGNAFLKAKKAFVPAIVVFDEAHDWFPGNDTPIVAGGGFGTRDIEGQPQLGGPVVVVGVMPGDNVSVMPGDNVSVMPGDNATAPKVGVTFFAAGPGDD